MPHYMVVSPDTKRWSGGYPYEYEACVAFVDAPTKAKAKAAALRTVEFARWLGVCDNPFKGLKVEVTLCSHGRCWCDECIKANGECPECKAKLDADYEALFDDDGYAKGTRDGILAHGN